MVSAVASYPCSDGPVTHRITELKSNQNAQKGDSTAAMTLASVIHWRSMGLVGELRALSVKRQIGKELPEAMRFRKLTVRQTAHQLKTTPTQIRRLLDWNSEDVKVDVLLRAAFVIGRELQISLTDGRDN